MSIRALAINDFNEILREVLEYVKKLKDLELIEISRNKKSILKLIEKSDFQVILLFEKELSPNSIELYRKILKINPIPIIFISTDSTLATNIDLISDFSFIETFSVKSAENEFTDLGKLAVKIKILSKLNTEKFQMQIANLVEDDRYTIPLRKNINQHTKTVSSTKRETEDDNTKLARLWEVTSKLEQDYSPSRLDISSKKLHNSIVVIGASTGGPRMVRYLISQLPQRFPPVVVVQHISEGIVTYFSQRISEISEIRVKEAKDFEVLQPGTVYIAPGGYHLEFEAKGPRRMIRLVDSPKVNFVRPSVDVTMISAVELFGKEVIGVILTGMGSDGTEGAKSVRSRGGKIIALNEKDSVIYGMNKSVIEAGLVDTVVDLSKIIPEILKFLRE